LQNYEFFTNFFQPKKKFVKFEFSIYETKARLTCRLQLRHSPSHKPSSRLVSVSFMSRVSRATTSGDVIISSSSHVVTMSRSIDADFIVTYWNFKKS